MKDIRPYASPSLRLPAIRPLNVSMSLSTRVLDALHQSDPLPADDRRDLLSDLAAADDNDTISLLEALPETPAVVEPAHAAAALLAPVISQLMRREDPLSDPVRDQVEATYRQLPENLSAREYLLGLLTHSRQPEDLQLLATLMQQSPPRDMTVVAGIMRPLFTPPGAPATYDPASLFPQLLGALENLTLAALILDLANYLTRTERVAQHPAAGITAQLMTLLEAITAKLHHLQKAPTSAEDAAAIARSVNEAVPVAVSLCDALALIGHHDAIPVLTSTLELEHRRVRTEAAAALARLGDPQGVDVLPRLAAEPVARLRVLAFAEELGLSDTIESQYQTAPARAEAELALALSEPVSFGVPPTSLELLDQREQYWPGFTDPVECFLLRFTYDLGDASYSNIGIAGPLTHAFRADITTLPIDDIYAAFAGWHAEHEDIYEVEIDPETMNDALRLEVTRMERRLHDAGYTHIHPLLMGMFFGERVMTAVAYFDNKAGYAVVDSSDIHWLQQANSPRPPAAEEAYCIYKGHKLLRNFNA